MSNYNLDENNDFTIKNYNKVKPFSSFLPGLAGIDGIPMWCFYVNRGQGISSFGIRDKNQSIMEFHPANKIYQQIEYSGFRTFIKLMGDENTIYEPFTGKNQSRDEVQQMNISMNSLSISSVNEKLGIDVKVSYFTVPGENFAALARSVTITNTRSSKIDLEVLDGMPIVIPNGIPSTQYKEMGNTLRAWMGVENLENNIPFYKVRASVDDSSKVDEVNDGFFALSFDAANENKVLKTIVEPSIIFGQNTSLLEPDLFYDKSVVELLSKTPVTTNKVPCAITGLAKSLQGCEELTIHTLIGHIDDIQKINNNIKYLTRSEFFTSKLIKANLLTHDITDTLGTKTSSSTFDAYCRQTYLDNILRGGYPLLLGDKNPMIYYVYSRKHGDLERDYNFFNVAPEYYSQGNGNFRDVNQNRRSDVLFNPEVGDHNIVLFMNLTQTDGYNPLVVKGSTFTLSEEGSCVLGNLILEDKKESILPFISGSYTPGKLWTLLKENDDCLKQSPQKVFNTAMDHSIEEMEAEHGEGYWVDHWTYNMDLVDNYLSIFPENKMDLLFQDKVYKYFDNTTVVNPRSEKHVLSGDNVRQYGAIREDVEKVQLINSRITQKNWMRVDYGKGEVYLTNLFEKLLSLAVNKFALLDPYGMGIEMEANKPGWNDAFNGLPGLIGSSVGELYDLKRILIFLADAVSLIGVSDVEIPVELYRLMDSLSGSFDVHAQYDSTNRDFVYWDKVSGIREVYREETKLGYSGECISVQKSKIGEMLDKFICKVDAGIDRAKGYGKGMSPTYFTYNADEYLLLLDDSGESKINEKGFECVKVKSFTPHCLPYFMEGLMKSMKATTQRIESQQLYTAIKQSGIYDEKLKMYKTSESIKDESFEIGRLKAFTPGWLENESVFMHMEYKYLLSLLKVGLYDEFFVDMKTCLPPFLQPEVYGRSILEHSSFIASSANPNKNIHGAGFYARLTGTTAEFLSIWSYMMMGKAPLCMEDGELVLRLKPILPSWLFGENGQVSFKLFNSCQVTYHNKSGRDTFGDKGAVAKKIVIHFASDKTEEIDAGEISGEYAKMIRAGQVPSMDVYLK